LTPNPDKPTSRHGPWAVLVLALLVGLAFQGTRHLFDPDEGRYTNVATTGWFHTSTPTGPTSRSHR
jgi:4-amino-4-deoxy-L-arabinose transferase-like glycosyltransferase